MSKKKKYRIAVVFGHTIELDIKASNQEDAHDKAEFEASKIFNNLLEDRMLGPKDFSFKAFNQ